MADEERNRVCLGRITGAHGIRGEVRIQPFTEDPIDVAAYGPLEDEAGAGRFEIVSARPVKGAVVASLKGVGNRDQAEALKGLELFVDRARLPEQAEENVWYHADLIGLLAVDGQGVALGSIVAVQNYGAGDLLELRPVAGGPTLLVPFTPEIVPEVDLEAGRVRVDPPEGMID